MPPTTSVGPAKAIAAIDEDAWVDIDYTLDGQAQVAECIYNGRRLIVRRTRVTDRRQAKLWPDWRHFGFLTDLAGDAVTLDAFHRQHAVVELAIRDLKEGAGMDHVPSGNFSANSAWLQCAVLATNLIRWTDTLGETGAVDRSHAAHRAPRPARQPGRHHDPARPAQLALGRAVQPSPRPAPRTRTPDRLSAPTRHAHRTRVPARQPTTARTLGSARPRSRQQPLTSTSIDSDKRSSMNQPTPTPNRWIED